jgi:hypothetical protein
MQEIPQNQKIMTKIRTYRELSRLETFKERYNYLALRGSVGSTTFGFDRWINQRFYRSFEWRRVRNEVIVRDNGCDLGVPGYEIQVSLLVHHMNPVSLEDITNFSEYLMDPNYLITTTLWTHNAIHFGDESLLPQGPVERKPGDTKLW